MDMIGYEYDDQLRKLVLDSLQKHDVVIVILDGAYHHLALIEIKLFQEVYISYVSVYTWDAGFL